jgi:hypothetical protein
LSTFPAADLLARRRDERGFGVLTHGRGTRREEQQCDEPTVRMARRYGHIYVEAQRNAEGRLEPEQNSAGANERTKRSADAAPQ